MMPWYMLFAEGFGLGKLPVAPGTWGSLGAVLIALPGLLFLPFWLYFTLIVMIGFSSIPLCNQASIYMARKDPSNVVMDEFIGQWIALCPIYWLTGWSPYMLLIISFFLFRFFDVLKVFPANIAQNLPGGWGIVIDDCVAGIYAGLMLLTIQYI